MSQAPFPCSLCVEAGVPPAESQRRTIFSAKPEYQINGRDTFLCPRVGKHPHGGLAVFYADTGELARSSPLSIQDRIFRDAPAPPAVWGITSAQLQAMGIRGADAAFMDALGRQFPAFQKKLPSFKTMADAQINGDPVLLTPAYGARGLCGYECRIDRPKSSTRPGDAGRGAGGKSVTTIGEAGIFISDPYPTTVPIAVVFVEGPKVAARLAASAHDHEVDQYVFLGASAAFRAETFDRVRTLYFAGLPVLAMGDRDAAGTEFNRKALRCGAILFSPPGCTGVDLADEEDDWVQWEGFQTGVAQALSDAARNQTRPGTAVPVLEQLRREGLAILDKNGDYQVLRRPMAYRRILELDEAFRGQFRRNAMGLRDYFGDREIRDETITSILNELDRRYGLAGDVNHLDRQVAALCAENTFRPVRVYLESLPPWDGQDRIPQVLRKVLGAKGSDLNRAMLACWYIGAVARAFRPGCKMDTALVLKSTVQGNHKTTFFPAHTEAIPGAFLEGHEDVQSKDGILSLHTCWIAELGEIDRITRKRDAEQVKNFISKQSDRIRMPYGRRTIEMPRGFVVAGTTNSAGFLVDSTGHRRFFVIETGDGKFDLDLLRGMVPQLWAQAVAAFKAGTPWWLDSKMEDQHAYDMRAFEIEEPWVELVAKALADIEDRRHEMYPKQFLAAGVTIAKLLQVMGVKVEQQNHAQAMRVADILRKRNWTRKDNQVRGGNNRLRLWFPPQNEILDELAEG